MFLSKLFGKDFRFYLEKGDRFFEQQRYAEARISYTDALAKLDQGIQTSDTDYIKSRLVETGNHLGLMNLVEAEYALKCGDVGKANEHITLILELAEDVTIREKAEKLLNTIGTEDIIEGKTSVKHSCVGCGSGHDNLSENNNFDENLTTEDRFELLIHTLPGNLPKRYADMGKKFAYGYLISHEGNHSEGIKIFKELLREDENDILLYEIALCKFNEGEYAESEKLLWQALKINKVNPLCSLSLVHLMLDSGRLHDAVTQLNYMIEHQLLQDQASLILADVLMALDEEDKALNILSNCLNWPQVSRAAAEKLIPILEKQNRKEEAEFIFKKYLKGCC